MKEYPEPEGRIWDVVENVLLWLVAVGVWIGVYFAVYFAAIILEVAK